ncbi:hypothetical protein [Novosphingobium clariflavum]|uniref:Uncharacterized protein n=1 Tax=Novosphingobium clariflavum TaxID=2029884 RepID=A0ABV6S2Y3_9SPHN|nr:hypothetical protein [Novosphingobium clariflavum]
MTARRARRPGYLETYETPEGDGDLPDLESYETPPDDAASFADEFSEYDDG